MWRAGARRPGAWSLTGTAQSGGLTRPRGKDGGAGGGISGKSYGETQPPQAATGAISASERPAALNGRVGDT